jgi:hypothetical protein
MAILFLFMIFTCSIALDMSVISYDQTHAGTSSAWRSDDEVAGYYEKWLIDHGKFYNALGEKERRFEIFRDNFRFIDDHNSGNRTYKLGLNRFADLTNEEYRSMHLGTKIDSKKRPYSVKSHRYAAVEGDSLPD